ncbi:MAG: glycosyltransferase [Polyangiaceae bacterium]
MKLSVVVPIFREVTTLEELARRCSAAARSTGLPFEVLFVDDASGDGSAQLIRSLPASLQLRVLELRHNLGQFRATQAGLAEAEGDVMVVLDGDLQDPPEVIPALVERHLEDVRNLGRRITFAVKWKRDDPLWFRLGHYAFRTIQRRVGEGPPEGAGSFCAMDRALAREVAGVKLKHGNLAWVISALGYVGEWVPYQKQRRVDGESRVAPLGLVAEALSCLWLVTPAGRNGWRRDAAPKDVR